jgi:hypothetical protein
MYFGKTEFVVDIEMAERAQRDAQEAVQIGAKDFGIALDWSVDSIRATDEILDRIHRLVSASELLKEPAERFAEIFGSYFGEVVRRAQGATWGLEQVYTARMPALCVGPTGIVINPLRWAGDRIVAGTGRNLWTYYEALVHSIQTRQAGGADGVQSALVNQIDSLPRKLYTLRHDQEYFETGTSANGRQILTDGGCVSELMAIYFDDAGNLLECEVRHLPIEKPYGTAECEVATEQAVETWKHDIGFHPAPIRVYRFALPAHGVAIEDRPDFYEAFLKAPELEEPDEEERKAMFEQIREWDEQGNFVLYWGNDLWLDADGEVTSS